MAIYTILKKTDLAEIIALYGMELLSFSPISGGNSNSNYRVTTNSGEFMLTMAEERNAKEMKQLISLLQWIKKNGSSTSAVVSTLDGKTLLEYLGKPVYLKKWISGEVYEDLNADMLQQAAASMAKIHLIPASDFLPDSHPYGLGFFTEVIGKGVDVKYENWLDSQSRFLKENMPQNIAKGFIHGDLFFDNVLFENGQIKAIIDFEEACHYPFVFDLGMAAVGLCRTDGKIHPDKLEAFVTGYEKVRPLTPEEKKSIPFFINYAATATSCWRYWKYNIDSPNPDRKDKHWEMVGVAMDAGC